MISFYLIHTAAGRGNAERVIRALNDLGLKDSQEVFCPQHLHVGVEYRKVEDFGQTFFYPNYETISKWEEEAIIDLGIHSIPDYFGYFSMPKSFELRVIENCSYSTEQFPNGIDVFAFECISNDSAPMETVIGLLEEILI